MMYTPRSYLQQSPPSPRSTSERMGSRARNPPTPRSVKPAHVKPAQRPLLSNALPVSSPEPTLAHPPTPMHSHSHSQPVVIPPRLPSRTASAPQTVRARGQNASTPARTHSAHNADAIPPAVAALLAVTSIPQLPQRRRKPAMADRRISMDELIQEWKQDDSDAPSSVAGSPLDLLLGRVDESEEEYGSLQSMEQEKHLFSTSRSISSESLATLPPSLDYDDPSFSSHWDNISTPDSISRRSLPERRERLVCSPPKEDCVLDHPLLHYGPDECEDIIATHATDVADTLPPTTERFRSFKSNLTASLQALKSAAKSFSNFTAPSVPPDDFLTRSLLAPKFTSEMRPKHLEGLPSPALRRYLNPHPAPISPTELSMQLHDALTIDADAEPHAPMIQMQTYDRRGRSKSRRRSSDPFSEAGRALSTPPAVRQREPRENCDFLRVIVLEMNMRRVGKLDAKAVGKARIWLPPRKPGPTKAPAFHSTVPDRWIGIAAQ